MVELGIFIFICLGVISPAIAMIEGMAEAKIACDTKFAKSRAQQIVKLEKMQAYFDATHKDFVEAANEQEKTLKPIKKKKAKNKKRKATVSKNEIRKHDSNENLV